jgi:hypothetical protein
MCDENKTMQVIVLDENRYQTSCELSDQREVLCAGDRADMR